MTLSEFLLARIAEDKAWAEFEECVCSPPEHPAPSCPARVLAECEAKRRIVEAFEAGSDGALGAWDDYAFMATEWVIRTLSVVYADHGDYNESWKP